MAEEIIYNDQIDSGGDPDPLGLRRQLKQAKKPTQAADPLGLRSQMRTVNVQQPAFQVQLTQPTFRSTQQSSDLRSATPNEPIIIKKEEVGYIPDDRTIEVEKLKGKATEAHKKIHNELLANDDQHEKEIREYRRDSYTIENLRSDYKAAGQILSPQDEKRALQREKQRRYDMPVTSSDIEDIKTGTVLNEKNARSFIKKLNKADASANSWVVDKFNEISNDPDALERIPKIKNVEKEIKAGRVIYDPEKGQAFKPVGVIGSAIEAVKQKNQLYADRDFLKNTENDAAILSEYKARKKDQLDEPIPIPKGKVSEIIGGMAGTPWQIYAAGALGSLGGPQAGIAAATIVGGREMSKLEYPATFWRTMDEMISQGVPEFEAVHKARQQAEQAAEVGAITGAAMGLVGARMGAGALPKVNLSQGFRQAAFNVLKQNGYDLGKAGLEGIATGGVGVAGEMYKNKLAQSAGIKRDIDEGTKEVFEQNVLTTVALAGAIKLFKGVAPKNARQLMHGLSKLPDEQIGEMLSERVQSGDITQKAADETKQQINEYRGVDRLIPDDVSEEARFKIQDKIKKRQEIEAQIEGTDKAYHPALKEKIKAIDEEIIALSKEKDKPEKIDSGLTKEKEKEAAETAEEFLAEGILPELYGEMIRKDPVGFWRMIAQQAQSVDDLWRPLKNPIDESSVRDQFGDTVVDYAKELFPVPETFVPESVSVIRPGEINHPETITISPRELPNEVKSTDKVSVIMPKYKENAIPVRSAEEVIVDEAPGGSQEMVAGIPEPGEAAIPQEGQPAQEASNVTGKEKVSEGPDWVFGEKEGEATNREGQVGEPQTIGITHKQMDAVARELGLETYTKDASESLALWDKQAREMLAKDPDTINRIVNKLRNGKQPDKVETRALIMNLADKKAKYDVNPTAEALNEIKRLKDLYNISGREEARAFYARRGSVPVEETLADFHLTDTEYNKGAPLTQEQTAKSTEEYNKISKKQEAFDENRRKAKEEYTKSKAEEKIKEWVRSEKKDVKKDYKSERQQLLEDISKKWKKASKESLGISILPYAKELAAVAPDVIKLVKNVIQEGITELPDIIKEVHRQVKQHIDNITENDVHDIIAGVHDEKKPTRNQLATQLYETRLQAKLMNRLDDLLNGKIPQSESKKRQRNQKIEALRKQINELKDEMGLNERTMDEKLASLKGRYRTKIAELQAKISKGDYGPDKKPESIPLDKEGQQLKDELLQLKDERAIRLLKQQYADRATGEKIISGVGKGLRTGRQLQSGFFDVSYPFRQTIVGLSRQLLSLPFKRENGKLIYSGFESQKQLRKQFGEMYRAFGSEKGYRRTMADIKESPRFDIAQKSKLDLAEIDAPLERFKEEEAQQSYAEKIPVAKQAVRMSNRAATVIANKMKFDIFNQLVDGFEQSGKTFDNSPELYKEAAIYANKLVGRGFLGEKLEMASPLIGHVLYSLRLQASRLQLLTSLLNPRFYTKVPKEIRIEYLKDMTKFVLMGSAMLGLAKAAGLGVEVDPRSSDFGSIKWGDTRYDIWGGFKQYVTLFSRLLTASTKSPETGQINSLKIPFSSGKPKFGEKTYGELLLRFGRTKLSPEAGSLTDIFSGETFDKKAISARGELVGYIAPMIIGDVYDAWKDNGVLGAALTYILSTHGFGVQSHIKQDGFDELISGEDADGSSSKSSSKSRQTKSTKKIKRI